ncbi:LysR family transcriptional regulator [Sodalis endosymbiont of Spalangia cameroni]
MDLFRSMNVFITVVQAGSISAAAMRLGISPAMVGQYIAALEDRSGMRLLNRTTRKQSLTDYGKSYFDQCRDILERVAVADAQAETQQTSLHGKIRVTAPMTFGTERLMPALVDFRRSAPDVMLDIVLTDRTVDLVDEGIDIAFRIGHLPDSNMVARPLSPYRMMICASPDYLSQKGIPGHPSELADHEVVGLTTAARSSWRLIKGENKVVVLPSSKLIVNSGQAVRMAAKAGLGIVMQPEMLLSADVRAGDLIQLFPDWQLRERPMWLLYYKDNKMTPRMRRFITFAVTAFV